MPPSSIRYLFGCTLVLLCVPAVTAAQTPCDPTLVQNQARESGYMERPQAVPDRCEGIYKSKRLAAGGMQLVGLVAASSIDDLCAPGQAVHLVWPRPAGPGTAVHLQVESLRRNLTYRLNATRPIGSSSYQWPPAPRCNSDVRLRATELGALAKASVSRGGESVVLLLPVAIAANPNARPAPPYRFVVVPLRRINDAHVSLVHYRDGQNPVQVFLERPVERQMYLVGGQAAVNLSATDVSGAGLYRLRLSVKFESGESEAQDYYFLHAP